MRFFQMLLLLILCGVCACNPFSKASQKTIPSEVPYQKNGDAEIQKLQRKKDSLLQQPSKRPSQLLDSLKPNQA